VTVCSFIFPHSSFSLTFHIIPKVLSDTFSPLFRVRPDNGELQSREVLAVSSLLSFRAYCLSPGTIYDFEKERLEGFCLLHSNSSVVVAVPGAPRLMVDMIMEYLG
jgi:hypothetical protein